MSYPIGAFDVEKDLLLKRAQNGGYVVYERKSSMSDPVMLGAYSCAEHMLDALTDALVLEGTKGEGLDSGMIARVLKTSG